MNIDGSHIRFSGRRNVLNVNSVAYRRCCYHRWPASTGTFCKRWHENICIPRAQCYFPGDHLPNNTEGCVYTGQIWIRPIKSDNQNYTLVSHDFLLRVILDEMEKCVSIRPALLKKTNIKLQMCLFRVGYILRKTRTRVKPCVRDVGLILGIVMLDLISIKQVKNPFCKTTFQWRNYIL